MLFRNKLTTILRKDFTMKEPFYYYFNPCFYFKKLPVTEDTKSLQIIQPNELEDLRKQFSLTNPFSKYNGGDENNYTPIFIAFLAFGMGVGLGFRLYR